MPHPSQRLRGRQALFISHLLLMVVVTLHTTLPWGITLVVTPRPVEGVLFLLFVAFWVWLHAQSFAAWQGRSYRRGWVIGALLSFAGIWAIMTVGTLLLHAYVDALVVGGCSLMALGLAIGHWRVCRGSNEV